MLLEELDMSERRGNPPLLPFHQPSLPSRGAYAPLPTHARHSSSIHSSPSSSIRSLSPPPHHYIPTHCLRGVAGTRRALWIAVFLFLVVVSGVWKGGHHGRDGGRGPSYHGMVESQGGGSGGSGEGLHRGWWGGFAPRVVYEAPVVVKGSVIEESENTLQVEDDNELDAGVGGPLTELGYEADDVFQTSELSLLSYLAQLELFLQTHFPAADSDEHDPSSLINDLRSYFPASTSPPPSRPNTLFQTAPSDTYYAGKAELVKSWTDLHPKLNVTFHNSTEADEWVRSRFALENRGDASLFARATLEGSDAELDEVFVEEEDQRQGIVAVWDRLSEPAVLRSDFWRYLVLAVEGGIYADTDVKCLKEVDRWGLDPKWNGEVPLGWSEPSLVVGVEADVGDRTDWAEWYPRPLQLAQWTIASSRGHPVLIDTLRRIVNLSLATPTTLSDGPASVPLSVMEQTGPGPFTDAVLDWLRVQPDEASRTWADLRGLKAAGWRWHNEKSGEWGDTKVLSITGFSPGVGHMGAEGISSKAAMVQHDFAGSWHGQKGAEI